MCCYWPSPLTSVSTHTHIGEAELLWEGGGDRMKPMKVPIGHRRGSGASGLPKTVSCAAFMDLVAYAAESFFVCVPRSLSITALT
jgi:hypothetical protein